MKPEEKADELIRKYYTWGIRKEGQSLSWIESKECALIVVDELIENTLSFDTLMIQYWNEVKKQIELI